MRAPLARSPSLACPLQRLILPGEIIPRYEDGLHGRMMAEAFGMAVGQASESRRLMRTVRLMTLLA